MERHAEYQGWKNYETWAVALWLDNDRGSYEYWLERVQELKDEISEGYEESKSWSPEEKIKFTLADELKEFHEENMPEIEGAYADLLNGALSEVDWDEIAESLIER